ncbi:cyclin-D3-3 [Neltuma alba]|uniref:cyclin-D3-3 n=1 Tax=Neltuma alba TaxID=207710 RepID=UPI0010A46E43|nr:cyclin-D3-3-like [Prosopis alba]
MALREEAQDLQDSSLFLDALLCEEHGFDQESAEEEEVHDSDSAVRDPSSLPLNLLENDLFWEDAELVSLISKEGETHLNLDSLIADEPLQKAREDAVRWISKVCAHYGFSTLTTVLSVNYFDRFVMSLTFQKDKPWMTQLAAVACLALAAKVEEIRVPLLLDLQVEQSKYLFEAKTIQRMELLVLSTLNWRMNPVTPISFFELIVRMLGLKSRLHWEFLFRCQRALLCLILDSRPMSYRPSTLAVAIMIHVISEVEPLNAMEHRHQLMLLLKINEEQVNECYKLILKLLCCHEDIQNINPKRKRLSSPDGVIDVSFSSDCADDSWAKASPLSLSLEPMFKRSRALEQPMHLPSVNRVSIDVLHSPR